jgi:hypothetical protein
MLPAGRRKHSIRTDLPVAGPAQLLGLGIHHPLREPGIISRGMSGLAEAGVSSKRMPGTGTM